MLNLPNVTLVCVYTVAHDLHRLAIEDCLRRVRFGDVLVKSDLTSEEYAHFFHYQMPKLIKTTHVLSIQWDSWITNPSAWTDEFLDYDYIGAPWWYNDDCNVGNSGFCLRSKRLIEFIADHPDKFPIGRPEDHTLCRIYGPKLKELGFRFAPSALAQRFSFECVIDPTIRSFGFHAMRNFPYVLDEAGLARREALFDEYVRRTQPDQFRWLRRNAAGLNEVYGKLGIMCDDQH